MAAFEGRTGPDIDQYLGRRWTDWLNAIQSSESKQSTPHENFSKRDVEVARLRRPDMHLFGYRPATDDFFLAVCEHCGQPVKPQSLNLHYERKHKRKRVSVGSMSHSNRTKVLYPPVKHPTRVNHCIGPSTSQKPHPGHASSNIHQRSSTHLDKQRTQKLDSGIPAKSIDDMDRMDSSKSNRPERTGIKMISALPAKGYTSNKHDNFSSERLKPVKSSKVNNVISLHETTDSHSIKTAGAVTNPTHHVADANYHHRNHPKSLKNGTSYERKSGEKTFVQPLVSSHKSKKIFSTYHHHYHQQSQDSSSDSSISSDIPDVKASTIDPQSLRNVPRIVLSKTPVPTPPGSIKILPHSGHKRSRQASGNSDNFTSPSRHKMPMLQSPDRNKTPAREMSYQMPNSVSTTKTKEPKRKDMRNIPLKARKYDPNRHCGVLLPDNTRCTRSLTCKIHPLSAKRTVPGRIKRYDELVVEHAQEKQEKLREKNSALAAINSGSAPANSSSGTLQFPPPRNSESAVPSVAAPSTFVKQETSTTQVSASAPPTASSLQLAKSKLSVCLFQKNFAAWHVDCWNDTTETLEEQTSFLSHSQKHPQPLSVCQFSARRIATSHMSYSRILDRQLKILSKNFQPSAQKRNLTDKPKPVKFTPIPAATFQEIPETNSDLSLSRCHNGSQHSINTIHDQKIFVTHTALNKHMSQHKFVALHGKDSVRRLGSVHVGHMGPNNHKLNKSSLQRKSSTPLLKDNRTEKVSVSHSSYRDRSKSEQAQKPMPQMTINLSSEGFKPNATWFDETNYIATSNAHFSANESNSNNLSPVCASFATNSSSSSIVPTTTNTSSDVYTIATGGRNDQNLIKQKRQKKNTEKKKNISGSSISLQSKSISDSAITNYAIQQSLANSLSSEVDGNQITLQLPNGLNTSSNVLRRPGGIHSVTLSGNIGALTVTGGEEGNTYTENEILAAVNSIGNKKLKPCLDNKADYASPNRTVNSKITLANTNSGGSLLLRNTDHNFLPPAYVQNGPSAIEVGNTNPMNPIFFHTQNEGLGDTDNKHSIQLNVNDMQLDQAVLSNVFATNPPPGLLNQPNIFVQDGTDFTSLQGQVIDMTECTNTARTSDINSSFVTQ